VWSGGRGGILGVLEENPEGEALGERAGTWKCNNNQKVRY